MVEQPCIKNRIIPGFLDFPLFVNTLKSMFQISFQYPVVLRSLKAPFFRNNPGKILYLPIVISAISEIK